MDNRGNPPTGGEDLTTRSATIPGAAPDTRVHYLVVREGDGSGTRVAIDAAMVIGRVAPANLVLDDSQVSRNHCRVYRIFGDLFVTDLGSSNGTFLNGHRIEKDKHAFFPVGGLLQVGGHVLEHEFRTPEEVRATIELDRDLENASAYLRSLIPPPLESGPIRTDWVLKPSARLGGDVLGYHFIDERTFAIYLIDVSGHGTGPAMHAASAINVLRHKKLPGADPREPATVARYLNQHFDMEAHGGLYFTLWYGVFDLHTRVLAYCSAGHHASYLVPPGRREALALWTRNIAIGLDGGSEFADDRVEVVPGSSLYIFSDGVFEFEDRAGARSGIEDLVARILEAPLPGVSETRRLCDRVLAEARSALLEDDYSMVVATLS